MKLIIACLLITALCCQSAIAFASRAPQSKGDHSADGFLPAEGSLPADGSSHPNKVAEIVVDLQEDGLVYTPSQESGSFEMSYPMSAQRLKAEGYIELNYDINEQGKPVNLRFTRISGIDIFETLIEKNINDWEYLPATVDGVPIAQKNLSRSFTFAITKLSDKFPEPLMRREFAHTYLEMRQLLKEKKYEELGETLKIMEKANIIRFSENRQLSLVKFTYLDKIGASVQDKILTLERAIKDVARTEKTKKSHSKIKAMLFKLYVQNQQYLQALIQYNDLRNSEFSEDLLPDLAPLLELTNAKIRSGEPLKTAVKVDATGLATHYLSRRMFKIAGDEAISFTELRCSEFNVGFDYNKDNLYQLPFDWSGCRLVVRAPEGSLLTVSESAIYDSF
jgi:TonB family protein